MYERCLLEVVDVNIIKSYPIISIAYMFYKRPSRFLFLSNISIPYTSVREAHRKKHKKNDVYTRTWYRHNYGMYLIYCNERNKFFDSVSLTRSISVVLQFHIVGLNKLMVKS